MHCCFVISAAQAMLESANELAAHLSQQRNRKQKTHVQLGERLKHIQQLDAVVSARRDLIKQLVRNNHVFRQR